MRVDNVEDVIKLVTLEKLDEGLFRGQNYSSPWKRIFGGQVLAQSLMAAYNTIPQDRIAHSLHGYFILTGDISVPVIYQVETIRDGGSFSTRRVKAIQKGRAIFVMSASFQLKQEGLSHQDSMPIVTSPSELENDIVQAEELKDKYPLFYKMFTAMRQGAIEFKTENKLVPESDKHHVRNIWMKLIESSQKLDARMQQVLLTYASDYNLLLTAVYVHRKELNFENVFFASLDHAIWFHREVNFNDWLLYNIESPSASNSRGMGLGKVFSKSGTHIATVMQEGLIRVHKK